MRLFGYPFPVVMVSVTDRSLRSYARKHILRIDEPDYKRLTVPVFPAEDYRLWHYHICTDNNPFPVWVITSTRC